MEHWDGRKRLGYGAMQAMGLGWLAGAVELAFVASGLQVRPIAVELLLLGATAVLLDGLLGALLGVVAGVIVHALSRDEETSSAVARQLALTSTLLGLVWLVPLALVRHAEDQSVAAAAMVAMPVGFAGVVFYNARYWLRRTELWADGPRDTGGPWPWLLVAGIGSLLVVSGGAAGFSGSVFAPAAGVPEDPRNIVIVTLEGVRHDDQLPTLTAIGTEGMRFLDAVSPSPHTTPAAATLLTGLHPLRSRVLVDDDPLQRWYRTIPETLGEEAYTTAAFVSSRAASSAHGLGQGFDHYDDDWMPVVAMDRLRLVGWALEAWLARTDPDGAGPWSRRAPQATLDRMFPWLDAHKGEPVFVWVHLVGTTQELDDALVKVRAVLQHQQILEKTLFVVTSTHGEMRGEHGVTGARSLYDPAVRIPLVVRAPGVKLAEPLVDAQVRLMDVSATALDWARVDEPGESEGMSLLPYGRGQKRATMWCSLVGRGADGQLRLGMRNNGVKYIREADGTERLFDLNEDPREEKDLSAELVGVLEQARSLLVSEQASFDRQVRERGGR